jgi:hypothetical protein
MVKHGGIIDYERNPFCIKSWIDQGFRFTDKRKEYLEKLFGLSVEEIKNINRNEGSYPACVGIRWGFAEIKDNRLIKTEKWKNLHLYDEYGEPIFLDLKSDDHFHKFKNGSTQKKDSGKKTKLSEKDMEDAVAVDSERYIGESGLKLIARQIRVGNYIFDLLFEDRHGGKLIVELQKGTLDRNHTYKILDYYDELKEKNPDDFIELMVIANKITRERRNRLSSYGIEFKEIPVTEFLKDDHESLSVLTKIKTEIKVGKMQVPKEPTKRTGKIGQRTGKSIFGTKENTMANRFCHALVAAGSQGLTMEEAKKATWNPKGYHFKETVTRLIEEGLVILRDGRFYVTDKGLKES